MTLPVAVLDGTERLMRCAYCGFELARVESDPEFADADGIVMAARPTRRYRVVFDACWFRSAAGRWTRQIRPVGERVQRHSRPAIRTRIASVLSSIGEEAMILQPWRMRVVEAECPRCSGVNRIELERGNE
jgi:phage FluMu protein Com